MNEPKSFYCVIARQNSEEWKKEIEKFLNNKDLIVATESENTFANNKGEFVYTAKYFNKKEVEEFQLYMAEAQRQLQQQQQAIQKAGAVNKKEPKEVLTVN